MKAPNKICIRKDDTAPFGFAPYWIYTTKVQEQDIVYIRKDALMEWLEERINDGDEEGLMTNQIANFAYKDVIDKINSL